MYQRGCELLRTAECLVAIGYNFSSSDRASYGELLEALSSSEEPKCLIVSPNAEDTRRRLETEFPTVEWRSRPLTFKAWVEEEFPESNWCR